MIYSGSITGALPAAGNAIADFDAAALNSAKLFAIEVTLTALGGGNNWGLGVEGNNNASQANPTPLLSEEGFGQLSNTTLGTVWSVAPLAPTIFYRRVFHNNAFADAATILTFPRGLSINRSGAALCLWAIASAALSNFGINAVIDE